MRFSRGRIGGMATLALAGIVWLGTPGVRGQAAWEDGDSAWLDEQARQFARREQVPGLAVAIGLGGEIVHARGYGRTSPDGGESVDADTRFRVASITKAVTAVAVFRLIDQGLIDLDAPAREYCPAYPARPVEPTVRHLLAHRSGLPHTTDEEDTTITGDYPWARDAVSLMARKPLDFTPGSDTQYTSWGYALLGCVIEGVTGQPYWDSVTTLVFEPVGMPSAARDAPDASRLPRFSPGYRPDGRGGMRPSVVVDTRFKTPASGLVVSARDLVKLGMAVIGGDLLSADSRGLMLAPPSPDAPAGSFALGWQVSGPREDGPRPVYHAGSMESTTALLFLGLERGFVVAILANRERHVSGVLDLFNPIVARLTGTLRPGRP
jgi:serine beta-lactamase-like protein LACTB